MTASIRDRIVKFIEFRRLSQSRFAAQAGLSNGFVGNVGNTLSKLSQLKIKSGFPELNMEWLMTGKGEMLQYMPEDRVVNSPLAHSSISGNNQIHVGTYGMPNSDAIDVQHLQLEIEKLRVEISLQKKLLMEKDKALDDKERMIRLLTDSKQSKEEEEES